MRIIILILSLYCSVSAEVNLRLSNETKVVLPELEVRARIFETCELLEVFYQGENVCTVSISGDRYHVDNWPNSPLFVSLDWSKSDVSPVLSVSESKGDGVTLQLFFKRMKKLEWRIVSDRLRFFMTDEELMKQRAMSVEDKLLQDEETEKE